MTLIKFGVNMKIKMDTIGTIIISTIILIIYFSVGTSDAKELTSFIIIGEKFSEVKQFFSDNYTITETAGKRITYSFLGENANLTQFATKNDIIEVVEVYNVYEKASDALKLYADLSIMMVATEKYKLLRAYNTTMEFIKGDVVVRIEQIPTIYGWLVKFTAYVQ